MSIPGVDDEHTPERLAFYASYGIDEEEARLHMAIDDIYKIRFKRLQDEHGYYGVTFTISSPLSEETRKAHAMISEVRLTRQEQEKAAAKRAIAKAEREAAAAAAASGGASPSKRAPSAQPSGGASAPQRAPAGALGAGQGNGASHGASAPRPSATLAPAQPSAGSADEAARALAAFTSRPDPKE